jgi:hypothetical protein
VDHWHNDPLCNCPAGSYNPGNVHEAGCRQNQTVARDLQLNAAGRWEPREVGGEEAKTFGCDHTNDDNPCPARVLYERAYQQDFSDLFGWMRFHHGWHAQDDALEAAHAERDRAIAERSVIEQRAGEREQQLHNKHASAIIEFIRSNTQIIERMRIAEFRESEEQQRRKDAEDVVKLLLKALSDVIFDLHNCHLGGDRPQCSHIGDALNIARLAISDVC